MNNQSVAEQPHTRRRQALVEKYGSEEAYRAHMSEIAGRAAATRKVNKGGTKEGGRKAYETRVQRYGLTYQAKIGRNGGKATRRAK